MIGKAALILTALAAASTAAADGAAIELRIDNIRSGRGRIKVGVYAPGRRHVAERFVAPAPGSRSLTLAIPPGSYAIMLYHDENGNGRLDRGMLGIPTEGYAFSNDAPVRLGPPSFAAMEIRVPPGGTTRTAVRMRYP